MFDTIETIRTGKISLVEDCIVIELWESRGRISGAVLRPTSEPSGPLYDRVKAAAFMALCHATKGINIEASEYQQGLSDFIEAEPNPDGEWIGDQWVTAQEIAGQ